MFESTSDILKQIALGEDSVLELKALVFGGQKVTDPHRHSMADELAAMANTHNGVDTPDSLLSNAFIQAVCYRGVERNAAYQLDAKDISGPLDIQVQDACKFVERNMGVYAVKAPHGGD